MKKQGNFKEGDVKAFDGNVRYLKGVIPDTRNLKERLEGTLVWQTIQWKNTGPLPRLCSYAVEGEEIGQVLSDWVVRFFKETMGVDCSIIGIFGNRYRNGNDYLPNHKDRYGDGIHVVSLSFGATRLFRFSKGTVMSPKFYLEDGDMIIFSPQQNKDYTHGIPKQAQIKEERINLTFFCSFRGNPYTTDFRREKIPSVDYSVHSKRSLNSEDDITLGEFINIFKTLLK